MMKKILGPFFLILVVFSEGCWNDAAFTDDEFTIVRTLEPEEDTSGPVLKGEIMSIGTEEIISYGFILKIVTVDRQELNEEVFCPDEPEEGVFSVRIQADNISYYTYIAFARTANTVFYGNEEWYRP